MDNAVALVQAYLRVNGYFTVTEYPIVATRRDGSLRAATDLDLLAVRFPRAAELVPGPRSRADAEESVLDAALAVAPDRVDMILGEVKEGRAELNRAASDPGVVRAALARFGCCSRAEARAVADTLLRDGRVLLPGGHHLRLAVFASLTTGADARRLLVIPLGHAVAFLRSYIEEHWEALRNAAPKDPAFGFLMAIAKAEKGET